MGHHSCCSKQKVRRGLWSPEEDEKLINCITTYGYGCWSSVPRQAGLQRCGKSCRLRWINYLRPDLKRGNFSPQEESLIIELHRTLGNRWAQIARHLPGRTDNEVKNFWNSCIKKKLAGDVRSVTISSDKSLVIDTSSEFMSVSKNSLHPIIPSQDRSSNPVSDFSESSLNGDIVGHGVFKENEIIQAEEWTIAPTAWASQEYQNQMPNLYQDGGFLPYSIADNISSTIGAILDQSCSSPNSILMSKEYDIMDMADYVIPTNQNGGTIASGNDPYSASTSYHDLYHQSMSMNARPCLDPIMPSSSSHSEHFHVSTSLPSNWELKH